MMHDELTPARWQRFSLQQQVLMVGTELKRLVHWLDLGEPQTARRAGERALELLDLMVETATGKTRRHELCRTREILQGILRDSSAHDARVLLRTLVGRA